MKSNVQPMTAQFEVIVFLFVVLKKINKKTFLKITTAVWWGNYFKNRLSCACFSHLFFLHSHTMWDVGCSVCEGRSDADMAPKQVPPHPAASSLTLTMNDSPPSTEKKNVIRPMKMCLQWRSETTCYFPFFVCLLFMCPTFFSCDEKCRKQAGVSSPCRSPEALVLGTLCSYCYVQNVVLFFFSYCSMLQPLIFLYTKYI